MHLWCRTMLSSVRISGEWKPLWFGKEPNHWDRSGCPRSVTRWIRTGILLLKTACSWERHFTAGECSWALHNHSVQLQTCSTNTAALPIEIGKHFLLPKWFLAQFQVHPTQILWRYLFPLYSKGNKWQLLPHVLLENDFIKNSTVKVTLFYLVVLFRISRKNPFSYAMMAAVRDNKWLDMKLPS